MNINSVNNEHAVTMLRMFSYNCDNSEKRAYVFVGYVNIAAKTSSKATFAAFCALQFI